MLRTSHLAHPACAVWAAPITAASHENHTENGRIAADETNALIQQMFGKVHVACLKSQTLRGFIAPRSPRQSARNQRIRHYIFTFSFLGVGAADSQFLYT